MHTLKEREKKPINSKLTLTATYLLLLVFLV